jgi:hypothetical protein
MTLPMISFPTSAFWPAVVVVATTQALIAIAILKKKLVKASGWFYEQVFKSKPATLLEGSKQSHESASSQTL